MFDIVVCSSNKSLMNRSINVITSSLINYDFDYNIIKINNDCYKLIKIICDMKRKIYIVDIDDNLDIVCKIRENDYSSIIILISSHISIDNQMCIERIMFLDYVCNNSEYNDRLKNDILLSIRIMFGNNNIVFGYNHVLYRILYDEINYIEKEKQIKRCIIHTIDNDYYVVNSIEKLNNILGETFIRMSQSCIINVMNIKSVDCVNNLVCFRNGDTLMLINDKMKKIIKEYM